MVWPDGRLNCEVGVLSSGWVLGADKRGQGSSSTATFQRTSECVTCCWTAYCSSIPTMYRFKPVRLAAKQKSRFLAVRFLKMPRWPAP